MRNELIINVMSILITLLFGAIAGWLLGKIGAVVLILVWRLIKKILK